MTNLERQLAKFWEVEEILIDYSRSGEEVEYENYFVSIVSQNKAGRYTVCLPFCKNAKQLGDSRSMALKRLISLKRKLSADEILRNEYTRVIGEHLKLGQLVIVKDPSDSRYYMPHHAVIKKQYDESLHSI